MVLGEALVANLVKQMLFAHILSSQIPDLHKYTHKRYSLNLPMFSLPKL